MVKQRTLSKLTLELIHSKLSLGTSYKNRDEVIERPGFKRPISLKSRIMMPLAGSGSTKKKIKKRLDELMDPVA